MQAKRRLNKADRAIVESTAASAVDALTATFDEVERRIIEDYLGDVPQALQGEFIREFMNQMGRVLFTAFDIHMEVPPPGTSESS